MLNLKNIFAATALLVATSSVSALEIELDNFTYQGPNSVFVGVDGDDVPGISTIAFEISQNNGTGILPDQPVTESRDQVQLAQSLFTSQLFGESVVNVDFLLTLDTANALDENSQQIFDEDGNPVIGRGDPSSPTDRSSDASVNNGISNDGDTTLVFDETSGIDAQLAITYSAADGTLFDISTFDAFYVDVLSAFEGLILDLNFQDADGATESLIFNSSEQDATGDQFVFEFSDISEDLDLTSISAITATINSPGVSADLILTSLGLVVRVPEPAALAILGLVLLGFGVSRRKA